MKVISESTKAHYKAAQQSNWEGRASNPDMGNQYWYQEVKLLDLTSMDTTALVDENIDIALLGYVCDEGVRRNRGRIGAALGPKAIRERLAKHPVHFTNKRIADVGDVYCIEDDMENCQDALSAVISTMLKQQIFPIAIGGGHDMSYGHFMGIWDAVKNTDKKKVGIINFDAHFDLRPVEGRPNSGTPFNQIIKELRAEGQEVDYFAIGIQQQSNTRELFEIAKKKNVSYAINYECESTSHEMNVLKDRLTDFIAKNDAIYITVDMDAFSSAYAPGVSAPSALGFTPYFLFKMLDFLFASKKVISCDIAELNPSLDRDNVTATLVAKIVDYMVMNISKISSPS
ncbi:MAG: formimidoylglutamase [Flavobacteriaceae bacterium]|nr:MAG: formimidoylglutamase [Flavobacteriaceae bacterium]